MTKLHLGSGNSYKKGWVNVDYEKHFKPDVVWDLNKYPYPFKDNEFDYIYAEHLVEHMKDIVLFMKELYRILKPGGIIEIIVPHFSNMYAYSDPTHFHYFMHQSFDFFDKQNKQGTEFKNKMLSYGDVDFKVIENKLVWFHESTAKRYHITPFVKIVNWFANKSPIFCERLWCYYVGGFDELRIKLEVKKDGT